MRYFEAKLDPCEGPFIQRGEAAQGEELMNIRNSISLASP